MTEYIPCKVPLSRPSVKRERHTTYQNRPNRLSSSSAYDWLSSNNSTGLQLEGRSNNNNSLSIQRLSLKEGQLLFVLLHSCSLNKRSFSRITWIVYWCAPFSQFNSYLEKGYRSNCMDGNYLITHYMIFLKWKIINGFAFQGEESLKSGCSKLRRLLISATCLSNLQVKVKQNHKPPKVNWVEEDRPACVVGPICKAAFLCQQPKMPPQIEKQECLSSLFVLRMTGFFIYAKEGS